MILAVAIICFLIIALVGTNALWLLFLQRILKDRDKRENKLINNILNPEIVQVDVDRDTPIPEPKERTDKEEYAAVGQVVSEGVRRDNGN
jgi:hypothetical protein